MPSRNLAINSLKEFLTECFTNSHRSHALEYSSDLSQFNSLNKSRESHLKDTIDSINKIHDLQNIHQVKTFIKHLTPEVRYFIFERALILSKVIIDPKYNLRFQIVDECQSFPQKIDTMLQPLWEEHLSNLDVDGVDLDTHLSHIIHQNI